MTVVRRKKSQSKTDSQHGLLKSYSSSKHHEANQAFIPVIDIVENEKSYNIRVELPGLKKEEIELHIDSSNLVLKGEQKQENEEQLEKFLVHESSYGSFYRSFPLPENVDIKQECKANLRNGILSIDLPKLKDAKSKPIPITSK